MTREEFLIALQRKMTERLVSKHDLADMVSIYVNGELIPDEEIFLRADSRAIWSRRGIALTYIFPFESSNQSDYSFVPIGLRSFKADRSYHFLSVTFDMRFNGCQCMIFGESYDRNNLQSGGFTFDLGEMFEFMYQSAQLLTPYFLYEIAGSADDINQTIQEGGNGIRQSLDGLPTQTINQLGGLGGNGSININPNGNGGVIISGGGTIANQ